MKAFFIVLLILSLVNFIITDLPCTAKARAVVLPNVATRAWCIKIKRKFHCEKVNHNRECLCFCKKRE